MAGKLCWALGLVLLFAAAVLTQAPLAVGLLGFFLLLTLLLVLEVRYLRGKVEAELIVPDQPAVQGRPFVLTVRLTNHSPLPIPQLLTLVQATDEWGGNTITLRCSGMLGSKARAEQRLTLQANKSGVWQLRLQSVTLWDHLGLFKAQCGLPQTAQSLCVLPQSARLGSDTQPDPDADGMQESDRSVLGGNYDVREYREGDSLKQVHWKLSAKLNRLLIREPLAAGTMNPPGHMQKLYTPRPSTCVTKLYSAAGRYLPLPLRLWYCIWSINPAGCSRRTPTAIPLASIVTLLAASQRYTSLAE